MGSNPTEGLVSIVLSESIHKKLNRSSLGIMVLGLFPETEHPVNPREKWVVGIVVVLLLLILAFIWYVNENTGVTKACTLDARICPDGSYVGRVAPTCSFAPCPDGSVPSG